MLLMSKLNFIQITQIRLITSTDQNEQVSRNSAECQASLIAF